MPPPVPVDSTTGVFMPEVLPNCSATVVVKGYTVDDPTMRIWSRASAGPASNAPAVASANAPAIVAIFMSSLLFWLGAEN